MRNYTAAIFVTGILALQACGGRNVSITTPESLIDRSSERVTFSLAAPSARQDIAEGCAKPRGVGLRGYGALQYDCAGDGSPGRSGSNGGRGRSAEGGADL